MPWGTLSSAGLGPRAGWAPCPLKAPEWPPTGRQPSLVLGGPGLTRRRAGQAFPHLCSPSLSAERRASLVPGHHCACCPLPSGVTSRGALLTEASPLQGRSGAADHRWPRGTRRPASCVCPFADGSSDAQGGRSLQATRGSRQRLQPPAGPGLTAPLRRVHLLSRASRVGLFGRAVVDAACTMGGEGPALLLGASASFPCTRTPGAQATW